MSEENTVMTLEDAQEALKAARTDAASQRTKAKEAREKLATAEQALAAYTDLGTPEEIESQLAAFESTLEGLESVGVVLDDPESLPAFFDALPARLERAGKADELEATVGRTRAAAALNVPDEALSEWLGDRKPVLGKFRDAEGNESEVYGLGAGDTFKPLSSYQTLTALSARPAAVVQPAAFTGVGGQREAAQLLTPAEKVFQTKLSGGEYNI
ncbi:hypothetical protein [Deinococcus sp.]|uniref:hypothetical protein n=1 Tax=Deinococcus sp. TaxID=47478 RepID=UPI00286D968C|nr:hypothetical protein [Deinococcus sp.]